MKGKVWLVGAGPGDRGLLTVKGKAVLEQAQAVLCDHLVGDGIRSWIPPQAEVIDAGKQAGTHTLPQEDINRLLLEKAQRGLRVVRLKGGDPFLFGRGEKNSNCCGSTGSLLNCPRCFVRHRRARLRRDSCHTPADQLLFAYRDRAPPGRSVPGAGFPHPGYPLPPGDNDSVPDGHGFSAGNLPGPACRRRTGKPARSDHPKRYDSPAKNDGFHCIPPAGSRPGTGIFYPGGMAGWGCLFVWERFSWVEALPLHRMRIWITRPKNRASALSDPWNAWGHRYWNCPRSKPKRFFPILCWKRLSILWPIPTGLPGPAPRGSTSFLTPCCKRAATGGRCPTCGLG